MPRYVRRLGLIGLCAVLAAVVSDVILLGQPTSAYVYFTHPTECMAEIADWRIAAGTLLGVLTLPFQLAGLAPLYYGMEPAGKKRRMLAILPAAHALNTGIAFHMAHAFLADGWKLCYGISSDKAVVNEMMRRFDLYFWLLLIVMLSEMILCACVFAQSVWRGETRYPKRFALCNPLFVLAAVFLVMLVLPSPVGGYIAPTIMNTTSAIFMTLSYRLLDRDKTVFIDLG